MRAARCSLVACRLPGFCLSRIRCRPPHTLAERERHVEETAAEIARLEVKAHELRSKLLDPTAPVFAADDPWLRRSRSFVQPLVADLTAEKCPPPAASSRAEARRTTPRPEPDTKLPSGAPALSKGATAAWIDKLELSEVRKNRALARSNTELDKCRGGDAGAAKTS